MEYNIPDLLDCLREVSIDIQPKTGASAERIKELTMKKIHSENKSKRRSLSGFTKILVAAAILATLAVPVMAATGFHFSDWLENMLTGTGDYGSDLKLGSASKNWEVAGWVFNLKAENVEDTGLTVVCDQWDTVQEKSGTLYTDEAYWLEIWNGQGYDRLPEPEKEVPAGKTIPIAAGSHHAWDVNWTDTYGVLEPGAYRLSKNFIYTSETGEQETVAYSVKFRIFPKDMDTYINQCKTALEILRTQDSYYLTLIDTSYENDREFSKRVEYHWKNGEDFLEELLYFDHAGNLAGHKGYLMRDGRGYSLTWNDDNALSGVASWEAIDWLDESNRDMWATRFEIYDADVGEVYSDDDTIHLINGMDDFDGEPVFWKTSFTTDPAGRLTAAKMAYIPSLEEMEQEDVYFTLEVHDTPAGEIAKVIDSQAVDKPVSFSWEEELAAHPAGSKGVKTEGFVNTASQGTITLANVVSVARKECTLEWQNTAVVFYDEIADMWKVELGFSQDNTICQTVYLDANGITQLIVE